MAIINSYPKDINIQDKDAWIGTDSYNRQTRQYTAEAVAKYLNVKGKVSIAGQVNYKFVQLPKTGAGTIALTAGGGDGTPFSALTEFKISKVDLSGQTVVAYLDFLVNQEILIMSQTDKEAFGHYTITSYVVDSVNSNFYTLQLAFLAGNGSITIDDYYDIVNFTFGKETDKNFVFTQGTASTTWNIQHDLNKFPSVSVVNNNNVLMYGETTYVDTNNLTINFSAGFSGKAYLN
jgi:hypothetical protein